ncbi:hypothetical protein QF001_001895 [Paraburkholderia youngii]
MCQRGGPLAGKGGGYVEMAGAEGARPHGARAIKRALLRTPRVARHVKRDDVGRIYTDGRAQPR